MDIWDVIADQRHQLVAILQNLNEGQWQTPSLCTEWTVRDVVGHLITPFELGMGKMFLRLIGNGFNVDKTLMKAAQQLARRPTSELVSVLRANAQSGWTPPGIGPEAPLVACGAWMTWSEVSGLRWTRRRGADHTATGVPRRQVGSQSSAESWPSHPPEADTEAL